jgi:hypothetical protein
MQDFLGGISGPGPIPDGARVGDYTELQVGPAFTQMQTFDVATHFSWSEYFSGFVGDPAVLLGDSYRGAVDAVNSWRSGPTSGVNDTRLADVTAGVYVVNRMQAETDSDVLILDGYGKLDVGHLALEGEVIHITGETRALSLSNPDNPDDP